MRRGKYSEEASVDDFIKKDQFINNVVASSNTDATPLSAANLYDTLNNDRDGGIALNEFPDVTYTNRADGSCCVLDYHAFRPKAAAAWIMNAMDSDRDGNIDASFLSACGITTHNPDASALHACFDLDGDGYINSVEFLSSFGSGKVDNGGSGGSSDGGSGSGDAAGYGNVGLPSAGILVPCTEQGNCMLSSSSCMAGTAALGCDEPHTGFFVTDAGRVQACVEQAGCLTSCGECVKATENKDLLICHHLLPGFWSDDDGVVYENECNVWQFPIGVVGKSNEISELNDPCHDIGWINGPTVLKAVTDTECWLECDEGYHAVYPHKDHYHWYRDDEGEDLSRRLTCGMIDGLDATTTLKCAQVEIDEHEHGSHSHGHGKHHGGKDHVHGTYDGKSVRGSNKQGKAMHGSTANAISRWDRNAIFGSLAAAISGFAAAVLAVVALTMLRNNKRSEKYDTEVLEEFEDRLHNPRVWPRVNIHRLEMVGPLDMVNGQPIYASLE
eukprot:gene2655-33843_t